MFDFISYCLRALAISSGIILCYVGFFIYEDEDAKVQNVLENWWVRIDDLKSTTVSIHLAFMKAAAGFASATLDRIFGARIISIRTISLTACLSLSSLNMLTVFIQNNHYTLRHQLIVLLTAIFNFEYIDAKNIALLIDSLVEFIFSRIYTDVEEYMNYINVISLATIISVLLPVILKRLYWLPSLILTLLAIFGLSSRNLVTYHSKTVLFSPGLMMFLTVLIGVSCDVIAISIVRILLRWQVDWTSLVRTIISAVIQLLTAIAIIVLPLIIGTYGTADISFALSTWGNVLNSIALSAATNILSAFMSLTFFGAGAILVIHRLIWPIITRLLYRLILFYRTPAKKAISCNLVITLILVGLSKSGNLIMFIYRVVAIAHQ